MDIVLPFKNEFPNSDLEGRELRFALRSIEKYLTGWNTVYLITDQEPKWFKQSDKARVIVESDIDGRKEYSCYRKLLKACDYVSVDFVYWNDDHFLLKPLDVSGIKNWHNGSLENITTGTGRWKDAKQNTFDLFPVYELLNFDIHRPMVFNKELFKDCFTGKQKELCIKTTYCYHKFQPLIKFAEDCNITNNLTEIEIQEVIKDQLFFSCKSGATFHLFNVLEKLYPHKSRFEFST